MSDSIQHSSWHEAVARFRSVPENSKAVIDNYFDLPVRTAAERFANSEEFAEIQRLLAAAPNKTVLDFGAGNGIATFALARAGWSATALEPDLSAEVGAYAIRRLAEDSGLPVEVRDGGGDALPFPTGTFGAIHARQVLHHVPDLRATLREMSRVLQPGGLLLATREHVADTPAQLEQFLSSHPLHSQYGGENAYPLLTYQRAIASAGLKLLRTWGPTESVINFYPGTEAQRVSYLRGLLAMKVPIVGGVVARIPGVVTALARWTSSRDTTGGRLYSFLARKP